MDLGLQDRVALVGGASRGLGRAVAEALAAEGADVVITARGEEALRETADAIAAASGRRAVPVAADLATEAGIDTVVRAATDAFDRVDILVTNTGGPPAGSFESHDAETWHAATRLLLDSAVGLVRRVLPGMRQSGWGRIVAITSIAVKQPIDDLVLSNSLRAAVTGFARTLANEVAPSGVTVNCVMPGYTRTERLADLADSNAQSRGTSRDEEWARWETEIPMHRLGEPEELAALVAFLCSERAAYITGTSIPVDGGWIRALL